MEDNDEFDLDSNGPENSLLPQPPPTTFNFTQRNFAMTRLGTMRAHWLGAIICIGGFLFGYDSGIIGGVLTLKSFETDFRYGKKDETRVDSFAVGLQQLGAFVACFAIWPVTHRYGRRWAIFVCSVIFLVGSVFQTINSHYLPVFYIGRIIAGIGLGGSSVVVPMFSSEMVPKQIRGQIGSFYQLMFTFGIFTSYWIDWGVANTIPSNESRQWQIPVALQLVPAAVLGLGMLTLKESVRWLTIQGRHGEAWESLKWIRADDGEDVKLEMEEIRFAVDLEMRARQGFRLKEMIDKKNFKRTATAALVFTAQQATGATAFAYFGPQYFQKLVGKRGNDDLLLTAIFGAVKIAACSTFVIFVADRAPRRMILAAGALFMGACQVTIAALVKTHPPPSSGSITGSGVVTVALIYLFIIAYNFSWGPLPWAYVSEIFPARTREPGIGVGVSFQWLFNFVFSITTPYMIHNMGWGTFALWGVFDFIVAAYGWFGLTETQGLSLEQITGLDLQANIKTDPDQGSGSSSSAAAATERGVLGNALK